MITLLLLGLLGGLIAGLLGIGGGLLFIVILPSALTQMGVADGDLPEAVIANSLYATFFSALGSTATHYLSKREGGIYIFWVGIPAAVAAALSLRYIASAGWFSQEVFSNVIIVLLIILLLRSVLQLIKMKDLTSSTMTVLPSKAICITSGAGAGIVSSLSGLGGGIVVVPAMRYWAGLPQLVANYVSSGAIVISSAGAVAAALLAADLPIAANSWGLIVPAVSTPLAIGVLTGSPAGVWLSKKLPDKVLTGLYCLFLLVVLGRKLIEAGYF